MSEKNGNEQNSENNACRTLLLIADITLVILLAIITIKGLSGFNDCKIDYKTISLFVFVIVISCYILHKCILCCRDVLNCCNSKPKAPDSKLKCIGICMGITYCLTVVSVIYVLTSSDKLNSYLWPVFITLSITAILFALMFYFIYRYHLKNSDDIIEDYLMDKEEWRKNKREKAEMESANFVKKSEFTDIKGTIDEIKKVVENISSIKGTIDEIKKMVENISSIKGTIDEIKKMVEKIDNKCTSTVTVNLTDINNKIDNMERCLNNINRAFEEKPTGNYAKLLKEFLDEGTSMIGSFSKMREELDKAYKINQSMSPNKGNSSQSNNTDNNGN